MDDRPLLTFYDDATGERTELSRATFENWVAKTANLLLEECEVGHGDDVAVELGSHWTTAAIVFACWRIGARVVLGEGGEPRVRFVGELGGRVGCDVGAAGDDLRVVVGDGMAGRLLGPLPPGAIPYGEEVPAYGDHVDQADVGPDDGALLVTGDGGRLVGLTQRNVHAAADAIVAWGLGPETRLLLPRDLLTVDGLVLGLLGPYLGGGSVVLVRDLDPATFWRKARDERATAALVAGAALDALPDREPGTLLEHVLCPAGAPLDAVRRGQDRLGVGVAVGHGLVEATCASSLIPADAGPEIRAWLAGTAAPTVGVATSHAEVAVLDEGDWPTDDGERAEVCVRGDVVAPPAIGDWLHTGDEGFIDTGPDGRDYIFLTGRV